MNANIARSFPATSRSRSSRPASSAVPPSAWPAWPTPRPRSLENSTGNASIVTSPDTYAKPAPSALPGWRHHHGVGRFDMFNQ